MAFSVTIMAKNFIGNSREVYLDITADDTSGAIHSGLSSVESVDVMQRLGTDRQVGTYPNSASASLTEDDPGQIFIENCNNGGNYRLLVIGR